MNRILSLVRRCVEDYEMIAPGDRIAVGVSGGEGLSAAAGGHGPAAGVLSRPL